MARRPPRSVLLTLAATLLGGAAWLSAQAGAFHFKDRMSAREFERCGLHKLSAAELSALEDWLARQVTSDAAPSPAGARRLQELLAPAPREEQVAFNVSSRKYHCLTCLWATRCTRNCITIPRSEALRRGGDACHVCGGICR